MNVVALQTADIPSAHHRGANELPFVTFMEGLDIQLLQADVDTGLWVIRARFAAGITLPRHKHTGTVFAITTSGSWRYLEYPEVNTAGSYLFEPAGSTHTLHVPSTNTEITEVWFAIGGANLNLDENGNVDSVWDAKFILDTYIALCSQAGHPHPNLIGM